MNIYTDTAKKVFSSRQVPWASVGTLFDAPSFTAAEASKLAGLDFIVEEQPVWRQNATDGSVPMFERIPRRRALVHPTTRETLSIVSDTYKVIQYAEAFAFMDSVSPAFVAGGSLRGGRQAFLVIDLGDLGQLAQDDPHRMYGILRTSHDTSRGVEVVAMPLRGRCMNMMTLRVLGTGRNGSGRWSFPHIGDTSRQLAQAQRMLESARAYQTSYMQQVDRLTLTKLADDQARSILTSVLPNRPKRDETVSSILALRTAEQVGFDGTGWGLVNALSEHLQWHRTTGTITGESQLVGALSGNTHTLLNRVTNRVLALAA